MSDILINKEQITKSQFNTSPSKMMYSFVKSKRFQ